jgi:hypothetical protein
MCRVVWCAERVVMARGCVYREMGVPVVDDREVQFHERLR